MSKLIKGLKITSAMSFVVLLGCACQVASAQEVTGGAPPPSFQPHPISPAVVAKGHVLKKTYLHTGNYGASVPASVFTPIDSRLTISCSTGPCTVMAHMLIENGGGSSTGNSSTLLLYVDGSPADTSWTVGVTPSDSSFINVTQDTQLNGLATGTHTVQMFYYTSAGATVAHYAATYDVYAP